MFAIASTLTLASCGSGHSTETTADSTTVVVDTMTVDTTSVDTVSIDTVK